MRWIPSVGQIVAMLSLNPAVDDAEAERPVRVQTLVSIFPVGTCSEGMAREVLSEVAQ